MALVTGFIPEDKTSEMIELSVNPCQKIVIPASADGEHKSGDSVCVDLNGDELNEKEIDIMRGSVIDCEKVEFEESKKESKQVVSATVGAELDKNIKDWTPLGTMAASKPLIRGSVVPRKAGKKNTPSGPHYSFEEEVADFYGQLWVIPSPSRRQKRPKPCLPPPNPNFPLGSRLFWIRKDKFRSGCFSVEDCYPVVHPGRFDPIPTEFQIDSGGLCPGKLSFVGAVKKKMDQRGGHRARRQPPKKGDQGATSHPPAAPTVPATPPPVPYFMSGAQMEKSGLQNCQVKRDFASMGSSLWRCSANRTEAVHSSAGQASGGDPEDCLAMI
ncbi:uncharacterized protein LOC123444816 isoform X1 [Hordeum vulgare subsp. vulgare]|uniref:uncharacterized protein LOC123444816 isoform X1 n=1 Tax=Hordeum vulgare subsp. vulgare TaxID=112509 RepID=UPI001D1A3A8F|nr:uncharacterized protein LOC123444816 isoform X1 [Hordeum vulgare subsp. vulgare]